MRRKVEPVRAPARSFVAFVVGGQRCAVPIESVLEIIRPLPVVAVPHPEDALLGVADHRRHVVPVIDLQALFGRGSLQPTRKTKWVVVAAAGRVVGLAVDAVLDVFSADDAAARGVPEWAQKQLDAGMGEVVCWRDELVFVLDPNVVAEPVREVAAGRLGQ